MTDQRVTVEECVVDCRICQRSATVVVHPNRYTAYRYCARCVNAATERYEIDEARRRDPSRSSSVGHRGTT